MRRKVGGAERARYDGKRVLDTNGATRALFWRLVAVAFQRVVRACDGRSAKEHLRGDVCSNHARTAQYMGAFIK